MAETTTTDLELLLNALDSKDEQTRADAMRQARSLSPDALLTLSGLEAQHFRRYHRSQRGSIAFLSLVFSSFLGSLLYLGTGEQNSIFMTMLAFVPFIFLIPLIAKYLNGGLYPSRARRGLTAALEEAGDVSFVPVALTLLQTKTAEITPAILSLLKRLLPQLHAGDAQTWTPGQYGALLKLLAVLPKDKDLKNTELALSVLKALEQIGDARAIPAVEVLAYSSPHSVSPQVQQAAGECLPYLRQRAGEQRQAQTLLRPTQPSTTGENLLRPAAQTTPQTPDEQLLRPQQQ